jgi:hypothetical protein
MLKLPSPSVVWAQNSPVIFTIGLGRSVVHLDLVRIIRAHSRSGRP